MPSTINTKTPIVLLHGINNSPLSWEGVSQDLLNYNVIIPLLSATQDVDEIAVELLATLPEKFVLVGHSFGGYVSLAILEKAPERVEAIIMINSLDNADTPEAAAGRRQKAAAALQGEYATIAGGSTQNTYHADNLADETLMQQRAKAIEEYGAERFAAHQEASARRPDRSAILKNADIPKLVIAAEEDRVILTSRQKAMAENAGARFVTIPGGGHMLPAEQPKLVAEQITEWLG